LSTNSVPSYSAFALNASYTFTDVGIAKSLQVWGGVDNLFDKDPPIVSSAIAGPAFGNGNTYPQVYDALGRKYFISLQYRF
jgi:outer membrane receptor protein involved in Fe transport